MIVITKRSPLDAGTVVKPGSKSYLDYALPAGYFFPTYGAGQSGIVPGRYPLPDRFYLPGLGRHMKRLIPPPEGFRRRVSRF